MGRERVLRKLIECERGRDIDIKREREILITIGKLDMTERRGDYDQHEYHQGWK